MLTSVPNIWVKRRRSAIHGGGLFAKQEIPEGTRIIEYVGHRLTKAQSRRRSEALIEKAARTGGGAVYIFELNKRHDIDGFVPWNPARLINHSCDPNCEPSVIRGHIWICALRDIARNEELTYNYGYDVEHWQEHLCCCGSSQCVGHIVARDQWRKLQARKRKVRL